MATDRKKIIAEFGDPRADEKAFVKKWMVVFNIGNHFPSLPFKKVYVNSVLIPPIIETFKLLSTRGLLGEIKKYDGCFLVRCIRGYENPCVPSIHSWGLAIDFNASDNPLGLSREQCIKKGLKPFSEAFFQVWRETGWVVGYDFNRKDGMHFQWTKKWDTAQN